MKSLAGQVVLLTGAAGGFGRVLTRLLLREGCVLVLADRERAAALAAAEAAAREVQETGGRVLGFVGADLGVPEGADELFRAALGVSPRIDMLINNAGLGIYGRIDEIPQAEWARVLQVNLLAPMRLTALVLPQMLERRSGHIVNVASAAALVGAPGMSVYSASKFGLRGFSESLAGDVRRRGVDVTTIYPFFARTPILQSPRFGPGPHRELPAHFVGDPEQIMAALVAGIKRRQLHIYPGLIARQIDLLRRLR